VKQYGGEGGAVEKQVVGIVRKLDKTVRNRVEKLRNREEWLENGIYRNKMSWYELYCRSRLEQTGTSRKKTL
jgi:hypothetical protein